MPWQPYQGNAQARARTAYQKAGGDPAELPGTIWCNPVRTLFAFLTDPDQARWLRRAEAAVAGLFASPVPRAPGDTDRTDRWRLSWDSRLLAGGEGAYRARPGHGRQRLRRHRHPRPAEPGTRRTRSAGGPRWPCSTTGWRRSRRIEKAHAAAGRPGCTGGTSSSSCPTGPVTATSSPAPNLERFDPHLLAAALKVASSSGLRTYYSLNRRSQAEATPWAASLPQTSVPPAGVDVSWPVGLLAPEVGPLAHRLAELGVPAPAEDQVGYELGDQGWQAELAWAVPRVAVIADGDERVRRRVRGGGLGRARGG